MKKISYILGVVGVILIIISILLLDKNNENIISWNVEYQNQEENPKNTKEYNAKSFQKIDINDGHYFYYIIPQDAYLSRVENNNIEYQNSYITISLYNYNIDDKEISSVLDSYDNSIQILKYELENGNILILKKIMDDTTYSETLYLFINVGNNLFYKLNYHIENMTFSNSFINEISDISKYKSNDSNLRNITNEWNILLENNNKKTFKLNYNSSKYYRAKIYNDFEMYLKSNQDSDEFIYIVFNYNKLGIDKSTLTSSINGNEKIKLKDYDILLYTTFNRNNKEYINYDIMIDNYTKLKISYPKSIEDKVDINDFLNFTYE